MKYTERAKEYSNSEDFDGQRFDCTACPNDACCREAVFAFAASLDEEDKTVVVGETLKFDGREWIPKPTPPEKPEDCKHHVNRTNCGVPIILGIPAGHVCPKPTPQPQKCACGSGVEEKACKENKWLRHDQQGKQLKTCGCKGLNLDALHEYGSTECKFFVKPAPEKASKECACGVLPWNGLKIHAGDCRHYTPTPPVPVVEPVEELSLSTMPDGVLWLVVSKLNSLIRTVNKLISRG